VTLVAGGIVGFMALSATDARNDALAERCGGARTCPRDASDAIVPLQEKAEKLATVTNVLAVTGGLLLTAGVVLVLLIPHHRAASVAKVLHPTVIRW
jgi:hypothetical protein